MFSSFQILIPLPLQVIQKEQLALQRLSLFVLHLRKYSRGVIGQDTLLS